MRLFETKSECEAREKREAYEAGQEHAGNVLSELMAPVPHTSTLIGGRLNSAEYDKELRDAYDKGIKNGYKTKY